MPRLRQWVATRTSFDEAARGALRTEPRQDAELQTANDSAVIVLRNHELDVLIAVDPFERPEIRRRQRVFEPFARAAERIVRQHPHNDIDVFTVGAPDGDRDVRSHGHSGQSQRAGGRPRDFSVSPIQRRTAA